MGDKYQKGYREEDGKKWNSEKTGGHEREGTIAEGFMDGRKETGARFSGPLTTPILPLAGEVCFCIAPVRAVRAGREDKTEGEGVSGRPDWIRALRMLECVQSTGSEGRSCTLLGLRRVSE